MPTYVYKFVDTGETIEVQQPFTEEALTEAPHPADGTVRPVKKVFTPVGITFGGSGFYAFLDDTTEVTIDTPYGPPSAPITIGTVGDRRVAFLPRHGRRHELGPHAVPYRANVWAMHHLGVRALLSPCACGSLQH